MRFGFALALLAACSGSGSSAGPRDGAPGDGGDTSDDGGATDDPDAGGVPVVCSTVQRGVSGTTIDAVITEDAPNAVQGDGTSLWTGVTPQGTAQSLLAFDLSMVPAGAPVQSATLALYVAADTTTGIGVHRIVAPWNEVEVTWNSFEAAYVPIPDASFSTGLYGTLDIDVTGLVQGWTAGDHANHGLLLEEADGERTGYSASEHTSADRRPALTVCWEATDAPPASCSDGVVDDGEECDDANDSNEDDCANDCKDATCGDGHVHAGVEECDDGNGANTDGCLNDCVLATCGDGHVREDVETCDDMNEDDTDGCPGSCITAFCGDGFVEDGVDECDDGNNDPDDGCDAVCVEEYCGDGIVQPSSEACEDNNDTNGDGCDNDCTFTTDITWETHAPQLINGDLECSLGFSTTGRRVAIDGDGTLYAALVCGGAVYVVASSDGGATFDDPVPLGITGVGEVAVAGGVAGVVHVAAVTTSGQGALVYSRSSNAGASFSTPVVIDTIVQTDRLSVTSRGSRVYLLAKSFTADTPLHLWRNDAGGVGSFTDTDVALDVSYFDVLIDPSNDDVWIAANYPGSVRARRSTDDGATFGATFVPTGTMAYGDWTLGGGDILTAGYGNTVVLRIPTGAPSTSNSATGLPLSDAKMRAISATPSGDAYVATRTTGGAIQLDQLLHAASAVSAPARTLTAAGTAPGVVALPDDLGAAVIYQVGTDVYVTVQTY